VLKSSARNINIIFCVYDKIASPTATRGLLRNFVFKYIVYALYAINLSQKLEIGLQWKYKWMLNAWSILIRTSVLLIPWC